VVEALESHWVPLRGRWRFLNQALGAASVPLWFRLVIIKLFNNINLFFLNI
jgi:hypothetical protein